MNTKTLAPIVLRILIALVLLWFGISQVTAPDNWVGWLPSWLPTFGLQPTTHILINGGAEIILAVLIITGLFTRIAASLSSLHMLGVVIAVISISGFDATAVRDIGVLAGIIAVALYGPDSWTIDAKLRGKES